MHDVKEGVTFAVLDLGGTAPTESHTVLLGVLIGASATIIAILFSVLLVVSAEVSRVTSPTLPKNILSDRVLLVTLACGLVCVVMGVVLLAIRATGWPVFANLAVFLVLPILLWLSIRRAAELLNPKNSVLDPAVDLIRDKIYQGIAYAIQKYACHDNGARQAHPDDCACQPVVDNLMANHPPKPDNKLVESVRDELILIKSVALRSINDLDFERARDAINAIESVALIYLEARRDFRSGDDTFMDVVYGELDAIMVASKNALKNTLHPEIAKFWKTVGQAAASVNVHGHSNGRLSFFPALALEELCTANLKGKSHAPFESVAALKSIGVDLMSRGFDYSARDVAKVLCEILTNSCKHERQDYVICEVNSGLFAIYSQYQESLDLCSGDRWPSQDIQSFREKAKAESLAYCLKWGDKALVNEIMASFNN